MSNQDDISKLYKLSSRMHLFCSLLFFANFILSIILLYSTTKFDGYFDTLQIIISILYFVIDILDSSSFWFNAEKIRFIHCLENALGIQRTSYKTSGYYNNNVEPSILRYCINTFENIFFTKSILEKMYFNKIIFTILLILFFITVFIEANNKNLIYIVVQTTFSISWLGNLIYFFTFRIKINILYENLNNLYTNYPIKENIKLLYSYSVEYDFLKAYYKIRLSSRIFKKINNLLSEQWIEKYKNIQSKI